MPVAFVYDNPDPALMRTAVAVLRTKLARRGIAICVSGIDGCGKTTLAGGLVLALCRSRVPARHLHPYQWYVNVGVTPLVLLYNRYIGRKILVMDRAIYDNIAVAAIKCRNPRRVFGIVLGVARALYPGFDYSFYVVAGFGETLKRRPDTCEQQFVRLTRAYDEMTDRMGYARIRSDAQSFNAVLRCIAAGSGH